MNAQDEDSAEEEGAAFPLEELDEGADADVLGYLRAVRESTTQANSRCHQIESNISKEVALSATQRLARTHAPSEGSRAPRELADWREQQTSHFLAVVQNLEYQLLRHPEPTAPRPRMGYRQLTSQCPQVGSLVGLQPASILGLLGTICGGYLREQDTAKETYAACLWLYSLLAVYKATGGPTHFEEMGEINAVVDKARRQTQGPDRLQQPNEFRALLVLEQVLWSVFAQRHLGN